MNRCLLVAACLAAVPSAFAASSPLFSDNFTVSTNSTNVSIEIPGARQSGTRAPLSYTEQDRGQDNYSQVNRASFEGRLFMAASSSANLVMVSPNANFNTTPGAGGVFYIEFDVNPVIASVANTNLTMTAWAGIKFGSAGQNKTVNDTDGFGILFRGEGSRLFQAFDDAAGVTPASPNDVYTASTADSFHSVRIELRRVTPGPNLFDGSPVQIKCFIDGGTTPILTYVRNVGFTSNFISLISETEGSGGDGITRHAFDNLRITAAPAPAVSLTLPGGTLVEAGTAIPAQATEAGVTTKVEFFLDAVKVGEDTTASDGFTFTYSGQAMGAYSLTAVTTDLFGNTATSAPVNLIVTTRPTVAFTGPASGSVFVSGTTIAATAVAGDADGTVAKVEFFRNGSKFGEDTNGADGFSLSYPGASSGSYTLTARATDNVGATSALATLTIQVSDPPTVSLIAPANNTMLDEPGSLTMVAAASDADGTLVRVDFLANGVVVAQDATAFDGYAVSLPNLAPGLYTLTAVATDNSGLSASSAPVQCRIRKRPQFDSTPVLGPNPVLAGQLVNGFASAGAATIAWNWGDGSTSEGGGVSHTYTAAGIYTATVSATSSEGVVTTQAFSLFVSQNLFGSAGSGASGGNGITGVLIGGDGVGASQGAAVKVMCDFVRRSRTSMSGILSGLEFPAGLTQDQFSTQPGTLRVGNGDASIPFSFILSAKGKARATSVKKLELNVARKRFAFHVTGQPGLTDLLEDLGARRSFEQRSTNTVRVPATLQIGTQLFLALTFEIDFTAHGRRGTGGLAE